MTMLSTAAGAHRGRVGALRRQGPATSDRHRRAQRRSRRPAPAASASRGPASSQAATASTMPMAMPDSANSATSDEVSTSRWSAARRTDRRPAPCTECPGRASAQSDALQHPAPARRRQHDEHVPDRAVAHARQSAPSSAFRSPISADVGVTRSPSSSCKVVARPPLSSSQVHRGGTGMRLQHVPQPVDHRRRAAGGGDADLHRTLLAADGQVRHDHRLRVQRQPVLGPGDPALDQHDRVLGQQQRASQRTPWGRTPPPLPRPGPPASPTPRDRPSWSAGAAGR